MFDEFICESVYEFIYFTGRIALTMRKSMEAAKIHGIKSARDTLQK
jgi:hypothetical protein